MHLDHLREILMILRRDKFFVVSAKHVFLTESIQFLGYVVSSNGLKVDPGKIVAIEHWPQPSSTT